MGEKRRRGACQADPAHSKNEFISRSPALPQNNPSTQNTCSHKEHKLHVKFSLSYKHLMKAVGFCKNCLVCMLYSLLLNRDAALQRGEDTLAFHTNHQLMKRMTVYMGSA